MRRVVGLVPAAGRATRVAPLPCSKEIFPIGLTACAAGRTPRPVCHHLLEAMRLADIEQVFVILREGKWDIPAYLGDGSRWDLHIGYLMMRLPFGTAFTLDQAYPFARDARIALGFPDIVFEPKEALTRLVARQEETGAPLVLGLFEADEPSKRDMVAVDERGRALAIQVKPTRSEFRFTWLLALWTPVFSRFLHEIVTAAEAAVGTEAADSPELFIGDVFQEAIVAGLDVETVAFPQGRFLDIGTPEDLAKALGSPNAGRS